MQFLEHFHFKTLKYDLSNKFLYKNTKKLPEIKKLILNFGCKTTEVTRLSASIIALELLTSKKGKITTTKKPNIFLKIRKGNPVGCKVVLRKKQIFNFLEKMLVDILPNIKNFNGITLNRAIGKKSFTYELHETLNFDELEDHYYLFNNLPNLNITIITNSEIKEELIFILKALQILIKIENKQI